MAVTQKQIADALGVSRSLVGEALGGNVNVAESTRQRVFSMALQMGYDAQANPEARSLIARRYGNRAQTRVVSLLLGYSNTQSHFVGGQIFPGVHKFVRSQDHDVLVLERHREQFGEAGSALVQDTRSDGLLLVNFTHIRPVLDALVAAGIPAVTCLSNDNPAGIPWVMADNAGAMQLAVDRLVQAGHRRILHISGTEDHADAQQRLAGFVQAMRGHGLECGPEQIVRGHWGGGEPPELFCARALDTGATGIVCSNDHQAMVLWNLAEQRGLEVPRDLSIIGMDDKLEALERGLTTVQNPLEAIGHRAAQSLFELMSGASAHCRNHTIPVQFTERASVAAPHIV